MRKRIKSVLVSVIAGLAVVGVSGQVSDMFVCKTNSVTGEVELIGYNLSDIWLKSTNKSVVIPGYVDKIGNEVFCNRTVIECIYVPDSVDGIGGEAFYGLYRLENIRMSRNLVGISQTAFDFCVGLESVFVQGTNVVADWGAGEHWQTEVTFSSTQKPWVYMEGTQLIFEGVLERSFDGVKWERVADVATDGLYTIPTSSGMTLYRTVVE